MLVEYFGDIAVEAEKGFAANVEMKSPDTPAQQSTLASFDTHCGGNNCL